MTEIKTIGLLGVGDMGAAVGRTLAEGGLRVVSDLAGRSAESRARALRKLGSRTQARWTA